MIMGRQQSLGSTSSRQVWQLGSECDANSAMAEFVRDSDELRFAMLDLGRGRLRLVGVISSHGALVVQVSVSAID